MKELIMLTVMTLSMGNPGAMSFLMLLLKDESEERILVVLTKIMDCEITGTDLYILYNDLCGRDMEKVFELCKNCPDEVLKDACSRQDRSGIMLVAEFLS